MYIWICTTVTEGICIWNFAVAKYKLAIKNKLSTQLAVTQYLTTYLYFSCKDKLGIKPYWDVAFSKTCVSYNILGTVRKYLKFFSLCLHLTHFPCLFLFLYTPYSWSKVHHHVSFCFFLLNIFWSKVCDPYDDAISFLPVIIQSNISWTHKPSA